MRLQGRRAGRWGGHLGAFPTRSCAETLPGTAWHLGRGLWLLCVPSAPLLLPLAVSESHSGACPAYLRHTVVHSAGSSGGRSGGCGSRSSGGASRPGKQRWQRSALWAGPAPVRNKRSKGRVGDSGSEPRKELAPPGWDPAVPINLLLALREVAPSWGHRCEQTCAATARGLWTGYPVVQEQRDKTRGALDHGSLQPGLRGGGNFSG